MANSSFRKERSTQEGKKVNPSSLALRLLTAILVFLHGAKGIKKVAVLDFDVHHGNGTEAVVEATIPHQVTIPYKTPFSEGIQIFPQWRPWLGQEDLNHILFARSGFKSFLGV